MRTVYITAALVIALISAPGCDQRQTTSPADGLKLAACISPYFTKAKPAVQSAVAAISAAKNEVQDGKPISPEHIDNIAPVILGASAVMACFEQ